MASRSNVFCCVPLCSQKGNTGPNGEKVGFFTFPKEKQLKKVWLTKIRRDTGEKFKINNHTKVCSLHFEACDIKKGYGGKMSLKRQNDVFPTKFAWRTSPRRRPAPKPRTDPSDRILCKKPKARKRLFEVTSSPSDPVSHSSINQSSDNATPEGFWCFETQRSLSETSREEINQLQTRVDDLCKQIACLRHEQDQASKEIDCLKKQNTELQKRVFSLANISDEQFISFYTGFPNVDTFTATFKYLNPGEDGENIQYWLSKECRVSADHYCGGNKSSSNKRGRPRTLTVEQEFLMVMCRLRQAFPEKHLAFLFGVSEATISRIFISWINFMFLRFGTINIWPTREDIDRTMPEDFKVKYASTRVIIDCTEIKCQMPSSLLLNSKLFSSYKNNTTLKGLIGISPSGSITFLSQLYTGSISDRAIVERSGFLNLPFDDKDSVMADKGFTIDDLLPLGVLLNIPPFLGQNAQMSAEEVVETQQIASLRIHVERAINKMKNFHIWDSYIPISLFGVVNQMWSVCGFLCNLQNPILS